jgi:hypothetical protein
VRSVEVDPRVAGEAERFFGLELVDGASEIDVEDALGAVSGLAATRGAKTDGQISLTQQSALQGSGQLGSNGWDVVGVDCFIGHGETPESCRSPEFISAAHSILKPGGMVVHHIWHASPDNSAVAHEFKAALQSYHSIFGEGSVQVEVIPRDPTIMWDDVIVARMPQ